jgi:hypothetical protein
LSIKAFLPNVKCHLLGLPVLNTREGFIATFITTQDETSHKKQATTLCCKTLTLGGATSSVSIVHIHSTFWNIAIRWPWIHDSDHRAIVMRIKSGWLGQLKQYRQCRQWFPLQLLPVEEQDQQTCLFGEL